MEKPSGLLTIRFGTVVSVGGGERKHYSWEVGAYPLIIIIYNE